MRPSAHLAWSEACERNQGPILGVLATTFADCRRVLEIGSGTGQHAVHFATALPHLQWQASDRADNLPAIRAQVAEAGLPNTPQPLLFDVDQPVWPDGGYDAVFSANTLHIMGWQQVQRLFAGISALMSERALLVVYGPFNDDGVFSSASNAAFDASLRARGGDMGLRDQSAVDALARAAGLSFVEAIAMPANNRCLLWRRGSA